MSRDRIQRDTRQSHIHPRIVLSEQRLSLREALCAEESVSRELLQYPVCEMSLLQVQQLLPEIHAFQVLDY